MQSYLHAFLYAFVYFPCYCFVVASQIGNSALLDAAHSRTGSLVLKDSGTLYFNVIYDVYQFM